MRMPILLRQVDDDIDDGSSSHHLFDNNSNKNNSEREQQHCCQQQFLLLQQQQAQRRKDIVRFIYNLVTNNGSDVSLLAPLLFDGRIDTISQYIMLLDDIDDDCVQNNDNTTQNNNNIIDRVHCNGLSYADFVSKYMESNRPVIIDGFTENWKSRKNWVLHKNNNNTNSGLTTATPNNEQQNDSYEPENHDHCGDDGIPNIDYLCQNFGSSHVTVHEQYQSGFSIVRPKCCTNKMRVMEFATWWKQHHHPTIPNNYDVVATKNSATATNNNLNTENNNNSANGDDTINESNDNGNYDARNIDSNDDDYNFSSQDPTKQTILYYLKDWKFVSMYRNIYDDAYEWPIYFRDDWLNEAMGDAYKFVYLGPAGTTTTLHADVIRSYSWSTNVCGMKRWYLIPPEYTYLLYDSMLFGTTQLANNIHIDVMYPGLRTMAYPGLQYIRSIAIEVIQKAGETIYVPSNWFHTVENLQPTLSINHNWINRYNIKTCWIHVETELRSLRQQQQQNMQQQPTSNNNDNTCNNNSFQQQPDLRSTDEHGTENCSTTYDDGNNSQVDDDVMLLWHVVSKKANQIFNLCSRNNKDNAHNQMHVLNDDETDEDDNNNSNDDDDDNSNNKLKQQPSVAISKTTTIGSNHHKKDLDAILFVINGLHRVMQDNVSPLLFKEVGMNRITNLRRKVTDLFAMLPQQ